MGCEAVGLGGSALPGRIRLVGLRAAWEWYRVRTRLVIPFLLVLAGRAFAFRAEGHQIIATIAAEKLKDTRAEREIAALFGDHGVFAA